MDNRSDSRLVFVIRFHEFLDTVIAPYLVNQTGSSGFSLSFKRLTSLTVDDWIKQPSATEKEVIRLLDDCRDEELMRIFSKKTRTVAGFYNELTESRLKSLIIPYVQKRTHQCLQVLRQSNIPLYFKGYRKDPVHDRPVYIQQEEAKAVFNFVRHPGESHYFLTLLHGGKLISVKATDSLVLVNTPGWIMTGGKVYPLESGIEGNKVRPFFRKDHVVIPRTAEEKYFRSFVANAIKKHEVRTTGVNIISEPVRCEPVLNLENDLFNNPVLSLFFRYGNKKCRRNDKNNCWVEFLNQDNNYSFTRTLRNTRREDEFIKILTDRGLQTSDSHLFYLSLPGPPNSSGESKSALYSLVSWLGENSTHIAESGIGIKQGFFKEDFYTGRAGLQFSMDEDNDWFDVRAWAVFGNFRIPFIRLKRHILSGNREYLLPDGRLALLPEEWFSRYNELLVYGKPAGENIKLKKHHFTIAETIGGENTDRTGLFKLGNKSRLSIPPVPDELTGVLRPYQRAGFAWMYFLYRHNLGGCLADDMGLGKTLQTLAFLLKLKNDHLPGQPPEKKAAGKPVQLDLFANPGTLSNGTVNTTLIVMPLSLMHNWENEIMKFTPGMRYVKYSGLAREQLSDSLENFDIVITTYGVVRNDFEHLRKIEFHYVILDESQVIKNPDSKISKAVRQLRSRHRLVLTGTPVENSLTDLWSQLSFLNPGMLGQQKFFQDEFVYPIEKQSCESKRNRLRKLIEPFILRRTKKLVEKDLPDLSEKVYYCDMGVGQKRLYDARKSEIRNLILEKLEGESRKNVTIEVLRGLTQLRLIANHPGLTGNFNEESGKYEAVIQNIENLKAGGHKILLFSQFVKHLKIYRDHFDGRKWKYSYLTGELNDSRRKEVISEFQNDPSNLLFLISLKAGGVGLNLTAADYVFLLDPWWNPAVEQQAVSRAHRIGQKQNVICCKYITADTVEEKILKIQQRKSELAADFINTNNPLKLFTSNEIMDLFE